jgi:hypothetical protein
MQGTAHKHPLTHTQTPSHFTGSRPTMWQNRLLDTWSKCIPTWFTVTKGLLQEGACYCGLGTTSVFNPFQSSRGGRRA